MSSVVELFTSLLPPKSRTSPSGWTSFNALCCHHKGHKADTRHRGGVRFDSGIVYNCFNCKFSTGWKPGSPIGEKMKALLRWMGASEDSINLIIFASLKEQSAQLSNIQFVQPRTFELRDLPELAMPVSTWLTSDYFQDIADELTPVVEYLISRGHDPLNPLFHWSPSPGFIDRVIIPFTYDFKIVGYTARKITAGLPKYMSSQQPNFVFNLDAQLPTQQTVLVAEGPFDALAVSGVALLHNEISEQQARLINSIGANIIVIPDQDQAGLVLYDHAITYNWSIASPNWDADVKDCADAVQKYGRLFVIVDAIKTAESGSIRITMAKHRLEKKLSRIKIN